MNYPVIFRASSRQCEGDALANVIVPSRALPEQCWGVTIVLGVRHYFFVPDNLVQVSLGIIAYEHSGHENATFVEQHFQPETFAFYPSPMKTFTLTLEQLHHPNACINVLEDVLLEHFVNELVATTECTLTSDSETESLKAELRQKESGTLLVEAIFHRQSAVGG